MDASLCPRTCITYIEQVCQVNTYQIVEDCMQKCLEDTTTKGVGCSEGLEAGRALVRQYSCKRYTDKIKPPVMVNRHVIEIGLLGILFLITLATPIPGDELGAGVLLAEAL